MEEKVEIRSSGRSVGNMRSSSSIAKPKRKVPSSRGGNRGKENLTLNLRVKEEEGNNEFKNNNDLVNQVPNKEGADGVNSGNVANKAEGEEEYKEQVYYLKELRDMHPDALVDLSETLHIDNSNNLNKHDLIFVIAKSLGRQRSNNYRIWSTRSPSRGIWFS